MLDSSKAMIGIDDEEKAVLAHRLRVWKQSANGEHRRYSGSTPQHIYLPKTDSHNLRKPVPLNKIISDIWSTGHVQWSECFSLTLLSLSWLSGDRCAMCWLRISSKIDYVLSMQEDWASLLPLNLICTKSISLPRSPTSSFSMSKNESWLSLATVMQFEGSFPSHLHICIPWCRAGSTHCYQQLVQVLRVHRPRL